METVSFLCLLTLSILGCDEPERISPEREQLLEEYKEVDLKITSYLGTLAAPTTPIEERKKIICENFPSTYEKEYIPIALKLSDPADIDTGSDLLKTIASYKTRYNIQC